MRPGTRRARQEAMRALLFLPELVAEPVGAGGGGHPLAVLLHEYPHHVVSVVRCRGAVRAANPGDVCGHVDNGHVRRDPLKLHIAGRILGGLERAGVVCSLTNTFTISSRPCANTPTGLIRLPS